MANSKATGTFIAECRKEKGLTQKALGEKLNVTDRAVSKCAYARKELPEASLLELCDYCADVYDEPRPGDLVFFVGTYDSAGVSHCGIYVGDGMMIHCGDPIQYANLNTSYWQSHFYAYGRLP